LKLINETFISVIQDWKSKIHQQPFLSIGFPSASLLVPALWQQQGTPPRFIIVSIFCINPQLLEMIQPL